MEKKLCNSKVSVSRKQYLPNYVLHCFFIALALLSTTSCKRSDNNNTVYKSRFYDYYITLPKYWKEVEYSSLDSISKSNNDGFWIDLAFRSPEYYMFFIWANNNYVTPTEKDFDYIRRDFEEDGYMVYDNVNMSLSRIASIIEKGDIYINRRLHIIYAAHMEQQVILKTGEVWFKFELEGIVTPRLITPILDTLSIMQQ